MLGEPIPLAAFRRLHGVQRGKVQIAREPPEGRDQRRARRRARAPCFGQSRAEHAEVREQRGVPLGQELVRHHDAREPAPLRQGADVRQPARRARRRVDRRKRRPARGRAIRPERASDQLETVGLAGGHASATGSREFRTDGATKVLARGPPARWSGFAEAPAPRSAAPLAMLAPVPRSGRAALRGCLLGARSGPMARRLSSSTMYYAGAAA